MTNLKALSFYTNYLSLKVGVIMKIRGFERVSRIESSEDYILPKRATKNSAGYDFFSPDNFALKAGDSIKIRTGIKSYFLNDECLFLYPRSSYGIKHGVMMQNTVGVVDADYYDNVSNEGEIIVALKNTSNIDLDIKKHDRFCQAVFKKILLADDDAPISDEREGGIGSTGKN